MEKDTNKTDHLPKDNRLYETFSLMLKDSRGIYLYRKSEKISKAFFLLTQHLDESQSIKVSLRNASLALLQKSQAFLVSARLTETLAEEVVLDLMSLVSLSDIALSAKLISEANCKIINDQIQIFVSEVYEHLADILRDNSLIPSTLFDVTYLDIPADSRLPEKDIFAKQPYRNEAQSQLHLKSHGKSLSPSLSSSSAAPTPRPQSQHFSHASAGVPSRQPEAAGKPAFKEIDDQKNQRQQTIVETIRQKGELSIKDLTDVIKGCSEKTIQRELVSLVATGVLLKTGERRWSRYSVSN